MRLLPRRLPAGVQAGASVNIGRDVRFEADDGGRIVLEDGCSLADGCRLVARGGEVRIGAGAVLGERCSLLAHAGIAVGPGARLGDGTMAVDFDHVFSDPETPIRLQPLENGPIAIGARARIGHGASVLRGVTVGDEAVVGEHAVVTRDVPAGARASGVPASVAPAPAPAAEGVEQPLGGKQLEET